MTIGRVSPIIESVDVAVYDGVANRPPSGYRWPGILGRDISDDKLETWVDDEWSTLVKPVLGPVGRYTPTGLATYDVGQERSGFWSFGPNGICHVWGAIFYGTPPVASLPTGDAVIGLPFYPLFQDQSAVIGVGWKFVVFSDTTYVPTVCTLFNDIDPDAPPGFIMFHRGGTPIQTAAGGTPTMASWYVKYYADETRPADASVI